MLPCRKGGALLRVRVRQQSCLPSLQSTRAKPGLQAKCEIDCAPSAYEAKRRSHLEVRDGSGRVRRGRSAALHSVLPPSGTRRILGAEPSLSFTTLTATTVSAHIPRKTSPKPPLPMRSLPPRSYEISVGSTCHMGRGTRPESSSRRALPTFEGPLSATLPSHFRLCNASHRHRRTHAGLTPHNEVSPERHRTKQPHTSAWCAFGTKADGDDYMCCTPSRGSPSRLNACQCRTSPMHDEARKPHTRSFGPSNTLAQHKLHHLHPAFALDVCRCVERRPQNRRVACMNSKCAFACICTLTLHPPWCAIVTCTSSRLAAQV